MNISEASEVIQAMFEIDMNSLDMIDQAEFLCATAEYAKILKPIVIKNLDKVHGKETFFTETVIPKISQKIKRGGKMLADFIKSWFYYPKMIKYFKKMKCYEQHIEQLSRFRYSWWHCHVGRLKSEE